MTFDVGGISVGINFSNSGLYLRELGDVREKHLNSMIALNKSNQYWSIIVLLFGWNHIGIGRTRYLIKAKINAETENLNENVSRETLNKIIKREFGGECDSNVKMCLFVY